MATPEEIRHRVEGADTARSARRAATAQQIGELAQRRAVIAEQLEDIERQLGDILTAASDVIAIDELAQFTDVKAADLTRWRDARTTRTRRKKSAAPDVTSNLSKGMTPRTPVKTTTAEPATSRADTPALP